MSSLSSQSRVTISPPSPSRLFSERFTEEEDDKLWGEGETKFQKAQSRLFAWMDRAYRMALPVPPLDDLVDKLGGPNVRSKGGGEGGGGLDERPMQN